MTKSTEYADFIGNQRQSSRNHIFGPEKVFIPHPGKAPFSRLLVVVLENSNISPSH
jgi:hypothetical protein